MAAARHMGNGDDARELEASEMIFEVYRKLAEEQIPSHMRVLGHSSDVANDNSFVPPTLTGKVGEYTMVV